MIKHLINGELIESYTRLQEIYNPENGKVSDELCIGDQIAANMAVSAAKKALNSWKSLSPLKRVRILFKYNELLKIHKEELAQLIIKEHGKVYLDALGEVQRGIEVVEFACGIPQLIKGDYSYNVATSVDSFTIRHALGICVGITPFNFPVMVPMWMFPIAIACGNTFILKPSERDPSSTMRLAELFSEAGLPKGVLNVVHGDKIMVDSLLTHPDVSAVSFVGSTPIAKYIYETASKNGKRVQSLGGAKNHCVVMPDSDINNVTSGLMGAAFGSAGERCMATSVVVAIGDQTANNLVSSLSEKIDKLIVAPGHIKGAEMGPLITEKHRQKIIDFIDLGIKQGAVLIKDGRSFKYKGCEQGFFVGASLFDYVTPEMDIYQKEIFGPVLCVVRVGNLKEAIDLVNNHEFANGSTIYTNNGTVAREYSSQVEVGMVGINIPIPVPMAFHSFGGWKNSLFGDTYMHGPEGIHFYTRLKTITTRWNQEKSDYKYFSMPTLQ